jgi:hypothetical protein
VCGLLEPLETRETMETLQFYGMFRPRLFDPTPLIGLDPKYFRNFNTEGIQGPISYDPPEIDNSEEDDYAPIARLAKMRDKVSRIQNSRKLQFHCLVDEDPCNPNYALVTCGKCKKVTSNEMHPVMRTSNFVAHLNVRCGVQRRF